MDLAIRVFVLGLVIACRGSAPAPVDPPRLGSIPAPDASADGPVANAPVP